MNHWSKIKDYFAGNNGRQSVFALIFYAVLSFLIIRTVWWQAGTVGFRHDWSTPANANEVKLWFEHALYPWIEARGGFSVSYLSDFLLRLSVGLVSILGIGGNILSKAMIYISLMLSGWFSFRFIKQISRVGFKAAIFSSLFYAFNPLTFNKIIAGHINYLVAYALAPLFFSLIINYLLGQGSWLRKIDKLLIAGLILALCTVQIQFAVMLVLVMWMLIWVYGWSWKRGLIATILMTILVSLIHSPWLVTMVVEMIFYKNQAEATPTIFSWYIHNSSQMYQAIFLMGGASDYLYRTLQDSYWLIVWLFGNLIILLIVVFGLIQIKEKVYKKLFLMWMVSIFLLTLPRVAPDLMYYLLNKSIIFSTFRELYHLAFVAATLLALLLAMSIQVYLDKYRGKWLSLVVLFAYIVFLTPFFWDGKLLGNLQTFSLPNEYVKHLDNSARTLFLPSLQPLLPDNQQYSGFDTSIYYSPTTSLSQMGRFSPLNERFATFWQSQLYFNSEATAKVLGDYLGVMGVKNVVWRPDIESDFVKYTLLDRYAEKNSLLNNDSLKKVLQNYEDKIVKKVGNWYVYAFDQTEKIEMAKPCYATGDWSDFGQIFLLQGKAKCNGVILSKDVSKNDIKNNTSIIINNNDWDSLWLKEKDNYVFEAGKAANLEIDPAKNWVSSEHAWWYDTSLSGYSRLAAITEKPGAKISLDLSQMKTGNYYLLVQKMVNNQGGEIKFAYQDWQSVIKSQDTSKNWAWDNLGLMTINNNQSKLQIENIFGVNAIGLVLLVPEDKWQEYNNSLNSYLDDKNLILMLDSNKTVSNPYLSFDFSQNNQFYPNYPEYSEYDLKTEKEKIYLDATFTGRADQNEFASLIYPLNFDVKNTPQISIYSEVKNTQVQFWEMALEIDQNNDLAPDLVLWKRLTNGQNILSWSDFQQKDAQQIDFEKIKIVGLRFQPHKEYGVDMSQLASKNYHFVLSDLRFYSEGDTLVRLPRLAEQIDLDKLIINPSLSVDLSKNNFYNDFPDTKQETNSESGKITIKSQFTSQKEKQEYGTLILDNNVSILDYPYFTAKLSVSNPEWQYYDLALGVDSNFDNEIDQTIWMDSIKFEKGQKDKIFFVDILNLLQQRIKTYNHPRVLYVKILPHRVNEIITETSIPQVEFNIQQVNFYHEAALQSAQKIALPTTHWPIDTQLSGDYQLFLNVGSGAFGKISGVVNNRNFDLDIPANLNRQWVKVGKVELKNGTNDLTLLTYDQAFKIYNIALFKVNDSLGGSGQEQEVDYKKINPTKYESQVKIDEPGYLVFKESYHPAWRVKIYDKQSGKLVEEQKPIVINGWEQGYWLDKAGDYRLEFDYVLTPIYRWGLLVTLFMILLTVIFVLINKIWWR